MTTTPIRQRALLATKELSQVSDVADALESREKGAEDAQTRSGKLRPPPEGDQDGFMVALIPQDEDANDVSAFAAMDPSELHTTLVFYGDSKQYGALDGLTIADALRAVALVFEPIEATLGGVTRFSGKDTDPVVLSVDSKDVHAIRKMVMERLSDELDLDEQTEHGYTPHMTLGYLPSDEPVTLNRWKPKKIIFDRIRVAFGTEVYDVVLGTGWGDKSVRRVATAAGVRKYNLPIGSVIGADGPHQLELPLDLPAPDPKLNKPRDFERMSKKPDLGDVRLDYEHMMARWERAYDDEQTWKPNDNQSYRDSPTSRFYDDYGFDPDSYSESGIAGAVAEGPWTGFDACRAIRRASYDMLGFKSTDQSQTRGDAALHGVSPSWGRGGAVNNPALHAYALLKGIKESPPHNETLYRGVTVNDPESFIRQLREGDHFDMPLASFSNSRENTAIFGEDITFALQKGARSVQGGPMGVTPKQEELIDEGLASYEDFENYEFITGGRFRITGIRKNTKGWTVMLRQTGVFDPQNGMLTKSGMKFVMPTFSWMFDIPMGYQRPRRQQKSIFRRVRTPEGSRKFGQPIGSIIARDSHHVALSLAAVATLAGLVGGAVTAADAQNNDTAQVPVAAQAMEPVTTIDGVPDAPDTAEGFARLWATVPTSQWGGADVSLSVALPDGRSVWLYGDTLSTDNGFVHSTAITQSGGSLHVSHGGKQLLPDDDENHIYWVEEATASGDDEITVTAAPMTLGSEGPWDFQRTRPESRQATVTVDPIGNVTFKEWTGYVEAPAQYHDFKVVGPNHFTYQERVHPQFVLKSGEPLHTVNQNWDDEYSNHLNDDGTLRFEDWRPIFFDGAGTARQGKAALLKCTGCGKTYAVDSEDEMHDHWTACDEKDKGEKDVYGGMPGLRQKPRRPEMIERAKRSKLHARARKVCNTTKEMPVATEVKALALAMRLESKRDVIRHVRDTDYWNLPYGTPLIGAGGRNGTPVEGIQVVQGGEDVYGDGNWSHMTGDDGRNYEVGYDADHDCWVATDITDGGDPWDHIVVDKQKTQEGMLKRLAAHVKKNATKKPVAKRTTVKKKTTAKKTTVKKKAPAKAAAAKKVPNWQKAWTDLTPEEQQAYRDQRANNIPKVNPLTKKPWTPAAVKKKRDSNLPRGVTTLNQLVKRIESNGWRLVTDDEERHEIGRASGKPMPPGWSHVFVYEGADADTRKVTMMGLDWSYKQQPHQTAAARGESLDAKFSRYRALTKKLPGLATATERDIAKGDEVATVVRLMMLSGGRVDSKNGRNVTGSRGLTSLLKKDITINGDDVALSFDAKSGHRNDYHVKDPVLAKAIARMMKGKKVNDQVFPSVTATDTRDYIKAKAGPTFTNHDLRTAVANAESTKALKEWLKTNGLVDPADDQQIKECVKAISEAVGKRINDTPGTAYNSYMDPGLFALVGIPLDRLPARGAK